MATNQAEHQWNLDNLKDRYHYLKLDNEQAEKIQRYETERDHPVTKSFLSYWEEVDWEWAVFLQILRPDQLLIFEKELARRNKSRIKTLTEEDSRDTRELDLQHEKTLYLKNDFVPAMIALREKEHLLLGVDPSKIFYLKEQYRILLHNYRFADFSDHFRENRNYKPSRFKCRQLLLDAKQLWPDNYLFVTGADEPTKFLHAQIMDRYKRQTGARRDLLAGSMKMLTEQSHHLFEKHYKGWETEGWIVFEGKADDPEEQFGSFVMSLLLMDPAFYY